MRPIDADAIKLEKGFFENINNVPKFFEWLGKQPTIELVKHGHWIDDCTCSICHWIHDDDKGFALLTNYPYCPNCGVKMDGEEE